MIIFSSSIFVAEGIHVAASHPFITAGGAIGLGSVLLKSMLPIKIVYHFPLFLLNFFCPRCRYLIFRVFIGFAYLVHLCL